MPSSGNDPGLTGPPLIPVRGGCRPGVSQDGLKKQISYLHNQYQADIRLISADYVDISSSEIRKAIKSGKSIRGLVPQIVEGYILKNHLYH